MIKCPNCNEELEDGIKFCGNCGQKITETVTCQNCGQQNSTEFSFCKSCGASLSNNAAAPAEPIEKKTALPKLPFKLPKKSIAIGGACVAVVLVVVILLSSIFGGRSVNNFALYLKDGEMYYTDISKIEPWQVTTRLDDDNTLGTNEAGHILGFYTQLSKDGKTIFYVDKIEMNSFSLFYRSVNNPDKEPVKIDSDIKVYTVSESGDCITYLKGSDNVLYQHNLTDKEKIASDVSDFRVSDDGKKIIFLNKDNGLYAKSAGNDKEKIDSEVSGITFIDDDLKNIYYIKEGSLYKKAEGSDKVKIASELDSVIKVYESGEVFYLKSKSADYKLSDYVEDDMKDTDDAMLEPVAPKSPSYWDYDDYDEYLQATEKYEEEYDEYLKAKNTYNEKQTRDILRKSLSDEKLTYTSYTLYYYNGEAEKTLTDAFVSSSDGSNYIVAEKNPIIIYSAYKESAVTKVKLSEISSVSEVSSMVMNALYSTSEQFVAVKDTAAVIELTSAKNFILDSEGKTVYFLDDISEKTNQGDIYKMSISDNKPQKPELYDSDVYIYHAYLTDDDKFVYFKDVKDSKGELYVNKERIDYDVSLSNYTCLKDSDTVVYMTDWNNDKSYGTLKIYKSGKAAKIADDVYTYSTTPNGEVLYLQNYSSKYYKGELFLYKNSKSEKIDDDVTAIIPVFDFKYRGESEEAEEIY